MDDDKYSFYIFVINFLIAIQSIAKYYEAINYQLNGVIINPQEQHEDYKNIENNLQIIEHQIKILSSTVESHSIEKETKEKMEQCLYLLQEHHYNIKTSVKNKIKLMEEEINIIKCIEEEMKHFKQEMELNKEKIKNKYTDIKEIENTICNQKEQLHNIHKNFKQVSLPSVTNIVPQFHKLTETFQNLEAKISEDIYDNDKQLFMEKNFLHASGQLTSILECAKSWLHLELAVSDVNEINQYLNEYKIFFQNLQYLLTLVKDTYCHLSVSFQIQHKINYNKLLSEASEILIDAIDKGHQLEQCILKWNELLYIMNITSEWLRKQKDCLKLEKTKRKGKLEEYVLFLKNIQTDVQNHLSQITLIEKLISYIKKIIKNQTLEEKVHNFLLEWKLFIKDVDEEFSLVSLFENQWKAFENDLKELQLWIASSEQLIPNIENIENYEKTGINLIDCIKEIVKIQTEQENKESFWQQIRQSLQTAIRLEIYETEYGQILMKQLDNSWSQLSESLTLAHSAVCKSLLHLPSDLISNLWTWFEEIQVILTEKMEDINSFSHAESLLLKYQKLKSELLVQHNIIKTLNMNQKEKKNLQIQKCSFGKSLNALSVKWQEISSEVSMRIKIFDMLISKWTEFNQLSNNFCEFLQKHKNIITQIEQYRYKQKEDAINNSLNQLKILENSIEEETADLEEITKIGQSIQEIYQCDFIHGHISFTIESNQKHLSELRKELIKVKSLLEEKQSKWKQYHYYLESINNFQKKMEYMLTYYKSPVFHPKMCYTIIDELTSVLNTINENQHILQEFENITENITKDVEVTVQLELNDILECVQKRWNWLINSSETLLQQYVQFKPKLESLTLQTENIESWITHSKKQILQLKNDSDSFKSYQIIEEEIKEKQNELQNLEELQNELANIEIFEKSSIRQNFLNNNNNKLLKDCNNVLQYCMNNSKLVHQEMNDHQIQICNISKFLDVIEEKLSSDWNTFDDDKLEEVINNLKFYMNQIPSYEVFIFALSEKLIQTDTFNSELCKDILNLLLRWKKFRVNIVEKYISVQNQWLQRQNFIRKCRSLLLFLHELKNQLTSEIPSSYENVLKEYCKMQVLDIMSSAQQGVIVSLVQEGLDISYKIDETLVEKFLEQLYKLQEQWVLINNMLTKKKNSLLHLISLWQNYIKLLHKIQSWINTTDLQSLIFKKNCLLTIEEIKKEIAFINDILGQKIVWENTYQELHSMYLILIPYMNTESIEVIHNENSEIKNRLNELWEKFSAQLTELIDLESEWNKIQNQMTEFNQSLEPIQNLVEKNVPSSYDDLVCQLEQHKLYKKKIQEFESSLDCLENINSNLKEKFSYSEILQIRNNIITSRETLKITYYKLINQINIIEKNLQEWPKFHANCAQFLEWILNMEKILSQRGDCCLEEACQKLEKNYHLQIQQKNQEYDDLIKHGEKLIAAGGEKSICVQEDLEEIQMAWKKLIMFRSRRLEKLVSLLEESKQLQEKMYEFNEWLERKEHQLFSSVNYENFTYDEITKQIQKMEEYEEEIENQYRILRNIMSMCEMLMHDNDAIVNPVERDAIQRSIESYKRRWKELGTIPAEHKSRIEETWNRWKKIMIDLDEAELLLSDYEKQTELPKTCASIHTKEEICEELKKYELLYQSVQPLFELLEVINNQFEELELEGGLDKANTLSNRVNYVNSHWSELNRRINIIICRLSYTLQIWEEFQSSNEQLLMWLTELDLLLTETEYFPEKQESLKKHLKEIEEYKEQKNSLSQLSIYLQQRSEPSDSVQVEELLLKTFHYWEQLFTRFSYLQQNINKMSNGNGDNGDSLKEMIKDEELENINENENQISVISPPIIVTDSSDIVESSDFELLNKAMTHKSELNSEKESVLDELKIALKETEEKLGITEEVLRSQTPIGFETEIVSQNYSRLLATCRCSIDILKHFNNLLEGEEEGLSQAVDSHYNHALGVISRWEILEAKTIEKDRRLQQARHQWQQYMDDLSLMESWLETAEEKQAGWTSILKDMSKLESMIQNHREFLMEMIKHKPTILSLNMLTQKFVSSSKDEEKSEELQLRLKVLNKRWDILCQSATRWQNELQKALLQCPDFQNTLQELINWLEMSEERIHQMGTLENEIDHNIISIQYNKYLELKQELERCKPKVKTFEQTASNLIIPSSVVSSLGKEIETIEVQKQLNNVNNCLQSLINKCDAEIDRLNILLLSKQDDNVAGSHFTGSKERSKENKNARESELERSRLNQCYRYLSRVARASLPIQGLMLLLLGIASLVPMSEDDFSCVLTNNFARSFDPMLKYPDGPPPI